MAEYTKGEALDWARQSLRGQWTTLVTPFTADDHLDEQGLRSNIRRIRRLGTEGAGCTWGMGEFWSLTREERLRVYDVVSEEAAGEWPIAAHVTHTSAREMVLLAKHAEAVGFDLLIVAPPYMVTRTEQQVIDYVNQNHYPRFRGAPAGFFKGCPQGRPSVDSGLPRIHRRTPMDGVRKAEGGG